MDFLDHSYLSGYEETPPNSVEVVLPTPAINRNNNAHSIQITSVIQNPAIITMSTSSCNISHNHHNTLHHHHHHLRTRTPVQNLILSQEDEEDETSLQNTTNNTNNNVMVMAGAVPVTDINSIISSSAANKQPSFDIADFECSLCFRLFCRPVSTPCGHTFCKNCILSAVKFNSACPLCRTKLDPTKQKFSVNIVLLNVVEKYFKDDYQLREKEEQEEEEIFIMERTNEKSNSRDPEIDYPAWSYFIPPVRDTCMLLSCAD